MTRRQTIVFLVSALLGAALAATATAGASVGVHTTNEAWKVDAELWVDSSSPAPFNTPTARSEMANGRIYWNAVAGAWFDFNYQGTTAISTSNVNDVPDDEVWITDKSSGSIGGTTRRMIIWPINEIEAALVRLNTSYANWHISSSTTMAVNKVDLRSIASHELGHAWGVLSTHINYDCTSRIDAQTMCSEMLLSNSSSLSTYYRSLESHEMADFVGKY